MKIISGAQTGVDRAALDAALTANIPAGGWCPAGRKAEDGTIPEHYPVIELPGSGYRQRTRQNVADSDGTVIIYFGYPSGGTELTISFCIEQKKPYLLIDTEVVSQQQAAQRIMDFIERFKVSVLNAAGPRASGEADAYPYTLAVMNTVCRELE